MEKRGRGRTDPKIDWEGDEEIDWEEEDEEDGKDCCKRKEEYWRKRI